MHRLKILRPDGIFLPMSDESVCEYMKMITLEKVLDALKYEQHVVKVPEQLAKKAKVAIDRMLETT